MLLTSSVQVSPRLLGLALGQVLNLSGTMQWCAAFCLSGSPAWAFPTLHASRIGVCDETSRAPSGSKKPAHCFAHARSFPILVPRYMLANARQHPTMAWELVLMIQGSS